MGLKFSYCPNGNVFLGEQAHFNSQSQILAAQDPMFWSIYEK